MTIQEAIKSGKKFLRPIHLAAFPPAAFHINEVGLLSYTINDEIITYTLTREDILANDWVIQEQKITITLRDLSNAFYEAYGYDRSEKALGLYTLADILGFKQQI